uniref:TLC domain-containing protein n=1 Tax=Chromera velia CCMP2878 TaxID=1169474 RepID=A0A0G4IBU0_9ALVE|eukprot:Cvel_2203.t1-p1 / transcript=Cvel_2203.t1 / gene=Cvel_2203 / organism=Chromera_velia_CCMP2878 / gene_product=hypothetical protein / transcript_product=hypothetical protein / location=Cvel_scaffold85:38965-41082(-) / protein_length=256 / sequence_SO=supercontig / SO=protein_coding / is_pseudo=false
MGGHLEKVDDLLVVLGSCLAFSLVQLGLGRLFPKQKMFEVEWRAPESVNKLICAFHALLISGLTWRALLLSPFAIWSSEGWGAPFGHEAKRAAQVCLGYFMFDTVYSVWEQSFDMVVHHLVIISGLVVSLSEDISAKEMMMGTAVMEISTPFLHCRHFTRATINTKGLSLHDLSSYGFALSFFVCRILLAPFISYWAVVTLQNPVCVKIGAVAVQVLSFWWFWKLVQVIRRTLQGNGNERPKRDPKKHLDFVSKVQ